MNIFQEKAPKEVYDSISMFKKIKHRLNLVRFVGMLFPSVFLGSYVMGGWLSLTILPVSFYVFSTYFFTFKFKKAFELMVNGFRKVDLRNLEFNVDLKRELPEMPTRPSAPDEFRGFNRHLMLGSGHIQLQVNFKEIIDGSRGFGFSPSTKTLYLNEDELRKNEDKLRGNDDRDHFKFYIIIYSDLGLFDIYKDIKKRLDEEIGELVFETSHVFVYDEEKYPSSNLFYLKELLGDSFDTFVDISKQLKSSLDTAIQNYYASFDDERKLIQDKYEKELKDYEKSLEVYMENLAKTKNYFASLITLSSILISIPVLNYLDLKGLTPKNALKKVLFFLKKYDGNINSLNQIFYELVFSKEGLKKIHLKIRGKNFNQEVLQNDYLKLRKRIRKLLKSKLGFKGDQINFNIDLLKEVYDNQTDFLKEIKKAREFNLVEKLINADLNNFEHNAAFKFLFAFQKIQETFGDEKSSKRYDFMIWQLFLKIENIQNKGKRINSKEYKRFEKWFGKVEKRIFKRIGEFDKYRGIFYTIIKKYDYLEKFLQLEDYDDFVEFHSDLIKDKSLKLSQKELMKKAPEMKSNLYRNI